MYIIIESVTKERGFKKKKIGRYCLSVLYSYKISALKKVLHQMKDQHQMYRIKKKRKHNI